MKRFGSLILAGLGLLLLSSSAPAEVIALVGDRLIDGVADQARTPAVVLVEGDVITAVGGEAIIPGGARRIDLDGATLLPGLIDAHVHPTIWGDDYQTEHLRLSSAYKALRGLHAVQNCLHAGWTGLRL